MDTGPLKHAAATGDSGVEAAYALVTAFVFAIIAILEGLRYAFDLSFLLAFSLTLAFVLPLSAYLLFRWLRQPTQLPGRVLVVLPNKPPGFTIAGVAHAVSVFDRTGLEVVLASPLGGGCPVDESVVDGSDPVQRQFWTKYEGRSKVTLPLNRCPAADFVAIFVASGKTVAGELGNHPLLLATMQRLYGAGGAIGAVGLGLAPLAELPLPDGSYLLSGRQVSGCAEDGKEGEEVQALLLQRGSCVHRTGAGGAIEKGRVGISGRVITGAADDAAAHVARVMVRVLFASKKVEV